MADDKTATCAYNKNNVTAHWCERVIVIVIVIYVNRLLFFNFPFYLCKSLKKKSCMPFVGNGHKTNFGIMATAVKNSNLVFDAPAVSRVKRTLH